MTGPMTGPMSAAERRPGAGAWWSPEARFR